MIFPSRSLSSRSISRLAARLGSSSTISPPLALRALPHQRSIRKYTGSTVVALNGDEKISKIINQFPARQVFVPGSTLVVLLSASFATQLHTFTEERLIRALVEKSSLNSGALPSEVVLGVVDGLSPSKPAFAGSSYEGITLLNLKPGQLREVQEATADLSSSDSTLRFTFSPPSSPDRQQPLSFSVDFPLANTLFQLGPKTFLVKYSYTTDGLLSNRTVLSSISIGLSTVSISKGRDKAVSRVAPKSLLPDISFDVPLFTLTPPARVHESMGNIIRLVSESEPDRTGNYDPRPASTDLEQAVWNFARVRNEKPQSLSVYALIIPEPLVKESLADPNSPTINFLEAAIVNNWKLPSPCPDTFIPYLLERGATLHQVLSGGGEWGERAKLVSLSYREEESVVDQLGDDFELPDFTSKFGLGDQGLNSVLNRIAPAGHYVQYFALAQPARTESEEQPKFQRQTLLNPSASEKMVLGTVSKDWESSRAAPAGSDFRKTAFSFDYHVGILSKSPLTLTYSTPISEHAGSDPSSITEFDVPDSRITLPLLIPDAGQTLGCVSGSSPSSIIGDTLLDALSSLTEKPLSPAPIINKVPSTQIENALYRVSRRTTALMRGLDYIHRCNITMQLDRQDALLSAFWEFVEANPNDRIVRTLYDSVPELPVRNYDSGLEESREAHSLSSSDLSSFLRVPDKSYSKKWHPIRPFNYARFGEPPLRFPRQRGGPLLSYSDDPEQFVVGVETDLAETDVLDMTLTENLEFSLSKVGLEMGVPPTINDCTTHLVLQTARKAIKLLTHDQRASIVRRQREILEEIEPIRRWRTESQPPALKVNKGVLQVIVNRTIELLDKLRSKQLETNQLWERPNGKSSPWRTDGTASYDI